MRNSTPLRYYWLGSQLITLYGPFRCYSYAEAALWVAAIVGIVGVALWW